VLATLAAPPAAAAVAEALLAPPDPSAPEPALVAPEVAAWLPSVEPVSPCAVLSLLGV